MEPSDLALPSHAAVDPAQRRDAGHLSPSRTAGPAVAAGEEAAPAVPVAPATVPAVRPQASSWVVVSEMAVGARNRVVIGLLGEIDLANAGYLRAELAYLLDSGETDIVVDLTRTVSISSSGLGVLVDALKKARRVGGRLQLVAPAGNVLKILRITRLTHVFAIHPTLDEAVGR
jgi:anti-sigma B factor antagonist